MSYIIQAEEQELSHETLQQLATELVTLPELTFADATYRIRSCQGILAMEKESDAIRLSQRFNELGFHNFLLEKLLPVLEFEHLNLEKPEIKSEVELAAMARLNISTETTVPNFSILRMKVAYPRIPVPGSGMEERIVKHTDLRFYLDLFTAGRHWRGRAGVTLSIQVLLDKLRFSTAAVISSGVKSLLQGGKDIPTFDDESEYEDYISWLYQLRYAQR